TIFQTSLLNAADLAALNIWAANKQPEFILDSSFFYRNKETNTLTASATAVTINEALALKNKGGGIFIGTDHNDFTYTANQILTNFGFDGLFTGNYNIVNNLQGVSTSNVPIGKHILNGNGGNRTIEIVESLFSSSPGKVTHIGASFTTGSGTSDINNPNPEPVPEPTTILGTLAFSTFAARWRMKRKQQQKSLDSSVA
ncbi:MAG TPA: hypothetical protein VK211_00555, partial [Kamptonema sp.]|nr:hypothetical protein [Kamptonema sp.]